MQSGIFSLYMAYILKIVEFVPNLVHDEILLIYRYILEFSTSTYELLFLELLLFLTHFYLLNQLAAENSFDFNLQSLFPSFT